MEDSLESVDVKAFMEDGKQFFVESHWEALNGIPYAGDIDRNGDSLDGILSSDDKEKIDSIDINEYKHISNGVVLISPNGYRFLLTVTDDGKLGTTPYL